MVDTPRDGMAWADTVKVPKAMAACYVRVSSDPVSHLRYVRLSPAMARVRAASLSKRMGSKVTIYQAQGMSRAIVATVSERCGWSYFGEWAEDRPDRRRDSDDPLILAPR